MLKQHYITFAKEPGVLMKERYSDVLMTLSVDISMFLCFFCNVKKSHSVAL